MGVTQTHGSHVDTALPQYYQRHFATFDGNPAQTVAWNWPAFLFGALWYFVKGMWAKGLIYLAVAIISGGFLAIPLWIYGGLRGTHDYYLKHRRGNQLW